MNLARPTLSFFIPSVYDGTQLDCRIYLPRELNTLETASSWRTRGAIVAHPYAPLGGCVDDPVVSFLGRELLQAGYVVGTFNFRGAGDSGGRTSWTARPELADYVSFYVFVLHYLSRLQSSIFSITFTPVGDVDSDQNSSRIVNSDAINNRRPPMIDLVLGGYSYGSMISSHLPSLETILDLIRDPAPGTHLAEIRKIVEKTSVRSLIEIRSKMQLPSLRSEEIVDGNVVHACLRARISYLLVSPLLSPVSQLLTAFSRLSFNAGASTAIDGRQVSCPESTEQLFAHRTLAIYGNRDIFTSSTDLHKWSEKLTNRPQSKFGYREIDGAGHFWREDGAETQARSALKEWLRDGSAP